MKTNIGTYKRGKTLAALLYGYRYQKKKKKKLHE